MQGELHPDFWIVRPPNPPVADVYTDVAVALTSRLDGHLSWLAIFDSVNMSSAAMDKWNGFVGSDSYYQPHFFTGRWLLVPEPPVTLIFLATVLWLRRASKRDHPSVPAAAESAQAP